MCTVEYIPGRDRSTPVPASPHSPAPTQHAVHPSGHGGAAGWTVDPSRATRGLWEQEGEQQQCPPTWLCPGPLPAWPLLPPGEPPERPAQFCLLHPSPTIRCPLQLAPPLSTLLAPCRPRAALPRVLHARHPAPRIHLCPSSPAFSRASTVGQTGAGG